MDRKADAGRCDDDIDVSEIAALDTDFFTGAILTRSGESLIDTVRVARARGFSSAITS